MVFAAFISRLIAAHKKHDATQQQPMNHQNEKIVASQFRLFKNQKMFFFLVLFFIFGFFFQIFSSDKNDNRNWNKNIIHFNVWWSTKKETRRKCKRQEKKNKTEWNEMKNVAHQNVNAFRLFVVPFTFSSLRFFCSYLNLAGKYFFHIGPCLLPSVVRHPLNLILRLNLSGILNSFVCFSFLFFAHLFAKRLEKS